MRYPSRPFSRCDHATRGCSFWQCGEVDRTIKTGHGARRRNSSAVLPTRGCTTLGRPGVARTIRSQSNLSATRRICRCGAPPSSSSACMRTPCRLSPVAMRRSWSCAAAQCGTPPGVDSAPHKSGAASLARAGNTCSRMSVAPYDAASPRACGKATIERSDRSVGHRMRRHSGLAPASICFAACFLRISASVEEYRPPPGTGRRRTASS